MKKLLLFLLFLPLFTSCGPSLYKQALLMSLDNQGMMYGNMATMNGGVSALNGGLPTNLQPNVAAEQAAQIINSNMQSQIGNYWETEAKNQEFQQNMIQQFSEDVWKHPERYSSVPVDAWWHQREWWRKCRWRQFFLWLHAFFHRLDHHWSAV